MSASNDEFHRKFKELMEDPNLTTDEKFAIMINDPEWKTRFIQARDRCLAESKKITQELEQKGVLYEQEKDDYSYHQKRIWELRQQRAGEIYRLTRNVRCLMIVACCFAVLTILLTLLR